VEVDAFRNFSKRLQEGVLDSPQVVLLQVLRSPLGEIPDRYMAVLSGHGRVFQKGPNVAGLGLLQVGIDREERRIRVGELGGGDQVLFPLDRLG